MNLHDCNVFHPDRKPVFMGGNRVTGAAKGDLNAVAPQAIQLKLMQLQKIKHALSDLPSKI
jgi:hypothetical protein